MFSLYISCFHSYASLLPSAFIHKVLTGLESGRQVSIEFKDYVSFIEPTARPFLSATNLPWAL